MAPELFAEPAPTSLIDVDATFLPVGHMRQISRVTQLQDSTIVGEMELPADHWVWPEHFPGDPVFPGTLLLEGAGQLVALWAWASGRRGRPRLVRISGHFHHPVDPGAGYLLLKGDVQRKRQLYFGSVQVFWGDICIATIEAVLTVLAGESSP
jgi:3-hydroxymyristoyl/3-hydroxydecanoyl-(acyl carrier protein) dehydratase